MNDADAPLATPDSGAERPCFKQAASVPLRPLSVHRLRRGPWLQLFTPRRFEWNRYELPIPGLPPSLDGLRIVQLTDVHLRPRWRRVYDELLERIRLANLDLILISGDLIEHRFNHRPALPVLERFCQGLRGAARLGTYAILGNHDGDLLGPHFLRLGVTLIDGRVVRVCTNERSSIELIGVPGVNRDDLDDGFPALVPPREPGVPRIALSHYPDVIGQVTPLHPDLVLSGHTHGGQVCLPGGWPILTHDALPRSMSSGVHRIDDTWLVVGRGLGFATHQVRLFCPAEVIELVLRSA